MTDTLNMQPPAPGRYRHGDGGIYLVTGMGRSSADRSPVVIYQHLWPFESETWVRPLAEWHSRFTPLSEAEYLKAVSGDRLADQATITAKRTARKGVAKG